MLGLGSTEMEPHTPQGAINRPNVPLVLKFTYFVEEIFCFNHVTYNWGESLE